MEEGGGDVKLVPIVPTAAEPPLAPSHHYISSIFIHPPPNSTFQLTLMCNRGTGKHGSSVLLGLAGCAVLIGVLIEGGITNTHWAQIPSLL